MDKKILEKFDPKNGFDKYKSTAISLLNETIKVLNDFKIEYFLISGTLLGYVRHKDFIPWDDDIDLIVSYDIVAKLPSINEKYKHIMNFITRNTYIVKTCFKDKEIRIDNWWRRYLLDGNEHYNWPFIDLFTFKYSEDKKHIIFFEKLWNINDFFPAKEVDFLGLTVNIPNNPMAFLIENYGPDCLKVFRSNDYLHKKERQIRDAVTISIEEYQNCIKRNS